jgi:catechol 2,3-dioxygenase-like lactoylglutathione lyase family enzyme
MLLLAAGTTSAQPATGAGGAHKGAVLGVGTFTSFVENMDRTLAFYHDVFGLEVPPLPESGARPYNPENDQLYAMFDIPGARERHQSARLPSTNVRIEVMEVQDVPHVTVPLRVQDPGAATLVFIVRNVDEMLARLERAHVDVVTPGGKPVTLNDGARALLVRDLDGRFVELRQPAAVPQDAPPTDIVDMRLSIAVADMGRTLKVYRDVLGFVARDETPFTADQPLRALTGLAKAEFRRGRVQAPGSALWIEFVEYRGVDRKPLKMRIQDRGAARLQLRADDATQLVAAMKRAGLHVVSQGGGAVPIPPNFMGALVADPNNFFLTPFAPCDACAPRLVGGARRSPAGGAGH